MKIEESECSTLLMKYYKPKDGLPDPKEPLSQSLPSRVIAAENGGGGRGDCWRECGDYRYNEHA